MSAIPGSDANNGAGRVPRTDYRCAEFDAMFAGRKPATPVEELGFAPALVELVRATVAEELDRRAVAAEAEKRISQPTVRHCIELAAREFDVLTSEILSDRKYQPVGRARHVAMWLATKVTANSYPEIGRHFKRCHATVIHGRAKVEALREFDHDFREQTDKLLDMFIREDA